MEKFFKFFLEEHNAGVTEEEMTFKERFLYSHHYDDDTQIYWRMGISFNTVASIGSVLLIAILVGQRIMV